MDKSKVVGLITGTASVPQDDLSLDDKATIILYAQGVLKKEMEHLVTGHFRPVKEFASRDTSHCVAYACKFPVPFTEARIGRVFLIEVPPEARRRRDSEQFVRHRAVLTTNGDFFWWAEKCTCHYERNEKNPIPVTTRTDVVKDIDVVSLDRQNLRFYLESFPELFLKLLTNFKSVAETAFTVREQRQKHTKTVLDELTRVNRMISSVTLV